MHPSIQSTDLTVRHTTRRLLRRMVSPLCGFDQRISFMTRSRVDPRFMTAGAQLTGVHVLQKRPAPKFSAYHIGGGGVILDEPLIRALGESIERYSQLLSEVSFGHRFVVASYDEMCSRGEAVLSKDKFQFFTDEQYAWPQMPFQPFDATRTMTWTKTQSLTDGSQVWVPAQLLLIGYRPGLNNQERWLSAAVTTGTASHTTPELALRNALLELVQIDAAMGHWYTDARATEIRLDGRGAPLTRLIEKHFPHDQITPKFYWLPNPDLTGFTIACVVRSRHTAPLIGVGLGCDLNLTHAMYKALLEGVCVRALAKINLLYQAPPAEKQTAEPPPMADFDSNVAHYAMRGNAGLIDTKFSSDSPVDASDLPADCTAGAKEQNAMLVDAFRSTNKQLVFMDLTTRDVRELGFSTLRVWSPDILSLFLPGFPQKAHPRFQSYGAVRYDGPHPYA